MVADGDFPRPMMDHNPFAVPLDLQLEDIRTGHIFLGKEQVRSEGAEPCQASAREKAYKS